MARAPSRFVYVIVIALSALIMPIYVNASYFEVSMEAHVRAAPNGNADILETLHAGDHARVLNNRVQENGYYKLKTHNQNEGWVYRNRVRLRSGNLPDWFPSTTSAMAGFDGERCQRHLLFGVPNQSDVVLPAMPCSSLGRRREAGLYQAGNPEMAQSAKTLYH